MFKVAFHPIYVHPVPENHRFPMEKYDLLPKQLIHQGIITENDLFEPATGLKYDYGIHDSDYLNRLFNVSLTKNEERASGFKQSQLLIDREICITNGTIEAAVSAIENKIAFNIAGGTHHALSNRPEGFCLLNDQAIAAMHLLKHNKVSQILIIDLDVHQGNGTAEILKNEDRVFTFSMHAENNYPLRKENSNLDIGLKDTIEDHEYLEQLQNILPELIQRVEPDFVFYQAGVDILKTDKLGKLDLSIEGCKKRDEIVYTECANNFIPVTTTMGGGYSTEIKTILEAHTNTFIAAINSFS